MMKKGASILLAWTLITIMQFAGAQSNNERRFPDNFMFGTATSSYQVEGGWNASDKTESIWDHKTHTEPWRIKNETNGDIACDSYHQYKRDVEMLRELGVDFYKFSISWTRILPSGFNNYISRDGVDYYNNLINELLERNIKPVATIFHWDLPQSLQDLGGWTNPLIATWFEDYARVLFEQFGDRVKTWITINEPHSICLYGYGTIKEFSLIYLAPFLSYSGVADYLCMQNVLKSHARAYHVYNDAFRATQHDVSRAHKEYEDTMSTHSSTNEISIEEVEKVIKRLMNGKAAGINGIIGRVGITIHMLWTSPLTNSTDDVQATADYFECRVDLHAQPIFGTEGGFPTNCIQRIAAKSQKQGFTSSRLPQFTSEDAAFIQGSADFLGVNHYTTISIYRNSSLEGLLPVPSWLDDIDAYYIFNSELPFARSPPLKVVPWGLREALSYFHKKYNGPEIIITENGLSSFGGLQDEERVDYFRQYLNAVLDAILVDGVNVTGYTAWSLMDNFEWIAGHSSRYGLYEVDFEDPHRKRTARKSALVYKEIVRSRVIDPDYEPSSLNITIS